jgi:hypothetical protein
MAIEQVHAIPIIMDGVIGLSHGHGHIISSYLEAFPPPLFPLYLEHDLFFKGNWRHLSKKIKMVASHFLS